MRGGRLGRPISRRRVRLRLTAGEARDLGDPADELGGNRVRPQAGLRGEAGNVEGVVAGEDGSALLAHAASLAPAGFRMERTSAAKTRALAMAAGKLPTCPRSRSASELPNEKMARKALVHLRLEDADAAIGPRPNSPVTSRHFATAANGALTLSRDPDFRDECKAVYAGLDFGKG